MNRALCIAAGLVASLAPIHAEDAHTMNTTTNGYRGVWYQNQKLDNEYVFKYSGGLGTYCAKHRPFAVYCPEVQKTFFCYGGVKEGYHETFNLAGGKLDTLKTEGAVYHLVSYYDHRSGTVPRPTVLLDKHTCDAHDNPVISVDDEGYLWIFSTAHGQLRPAFVHRSKRPYEIDAFEQVHPYTLRDGAREPITNFSYMQAWHVPKQGFLLFFTTYDKWRRETCFAASRDGVEWTRQELANIQEGHYQISTAEAGKAACAFNYHPRAFRGNPKRRGLNWRTNLYYMETPDGGRTWRSADGTALSLPVKEPRNAALVHDYEKDGLLVYLKDIRLDEEGHPLILFTTATDFHSGPSGDPRTWRLARWTGTAWTLSDVTTSDSNYDMGSLYVESGNRLRIIAPTERGPQPYNPGGEVAMWLSGDGGKTWNKERQLTTDSPYNHTYVRHPVNASPDFYAFWADGNGRQPSPSRLYYCNHGGDVFRLPPHMTAAEQKPERVFAAGSK